jgi:heat shock protein HslJ
VTGLRSVMPLLVSLVGMGLVACGGSTPPAKSTPASSPFGTRKFLLQSNEGADLLTGTTVHLAFGDHSLSFSADCNNMGGDFTIEGQRVVVPGLFSTEMGCDARRHGQDEWLQAFFTSRPAFALEGNTLTLSSESARLVFLDREVADPDRALTGTLWEASNYIDGDTAMGLMGIEGPRITFAADGTWQARSVCLEASGRYEASGDRLKLSGTQAKQGECVDNDKTAAEFVRSVLVDGELTFAIDAGRLTLKTGGPRSLDAHAVEPAAPAP